MSLPYIGQLLLASWNFAPKSYTQCNGQLLAISQYTPLFSLLGTTYGGDGRTTFGLPNLQGRTPLSVGAGFTLGQVGGEEFHTLKSGEVPLHIHGINAALSVDKTTVGGNLPGGGGATIFTAPSNLSGMNAGVLTNFGGSQGHENRQPYLVLNWCIALQGVFPSQN
jgi:microcystin-dependent protein